MKTYTIGVEDVSSDPYFSFAGNEYRGFSRELLDMFAKKNNIRFIYKGRPIKRLTHEFINQKWDFKYPDNPVWAKHLKKRRNVLYSDPIIKVIDGVMLLPQKRKLGIKNLKTLGALRGYTPWPYLEMVRSGQIKLHESSTIETLIEMVERNRLDGFYLNIGIALHTLKLNGKQGQLVYDSSLPNHHSSFYLSSISHGKILKKFNQFLKSQKLGIEALKSKFSVDMKKND